MKEKKMHVEKNANSSFSHSQEREKKHKSSFAELAKSSARVSQRSKIELKTIHHSQSQKKRAKKLTNNEARAAKKSEREKRHHRACTKTIMSMMRLHVVACSGLHVVIIYFCWLFWFFVRQNGECFTTIVAAEHESIARSQSGNKRRVRKHL